MLFFRSGGKCYGTGESGGPLSLLTIRVVLRGGSDDGFIGCFFPFFSKGISFVSRRFFYLSDDRSLVGMVSKWTWLFFGRLSMNGKDFHPGPSTIVRVLQRTRRGLLSFMLLGRFNGADGTGLSVDFVSFSSFCPLHHPSRQVASDRSCHFKSSVRTRGPR